MKPQYIILHHSLTKDSETKSWGAIRDYHRNELGWRDIGYHFGIELIRGQYEILVGRMMTIPGAHCKEEGMNRLSLGICFVGDYDLEPPPHSMWWLGIELVRSLLQVFNIPKSQVHGHYEYAAYKSCPGMKFDVAKFRQLL